MTVLEYAESYTAAGLSVIPIRADGSKAPACAWKAFQERIPNADELPELFRNACGIAVITGRVSGFLEVLDFEAGSPFAEWLTLIEEHGANTLAASLVVIETPSGGRHVLYRCPTIEANQKLAMSADGKVTIETRGTGGYIVTVGSPAACHRSGKTYALLQGDLVPGAGEHSIPTIPPEQRELLLTAARSFNRKPKQQKRESPAESPAGNDRPGDLFNARATWDEILIPHGWQSVGTCGDEILWRRPGKDHGFSATTNYKGSDSLYVFSTNAPPLEAETCYSKFAAYATMEHSGDFPSAAKTLAARYELPRKNSHAVGPVESRNEPVSHPGETNSEDDAPKPAASLKNAVRAIDNHLTSLHYDDFLRRAMTGNPPREWRDSDDLELTIRMQSMRGFAMIGLDLVRNAAMTIAYRNRKNCVTEWLDSLTWDHEPRIHQFFEDHFGAIGTAYTRAASKNFWLSLVARAYRPGCQADNMIVLEGTQGIRKSSALAIIGGDWFAEMDESVSNYRAFAEALQGKWLVEISELDSFNRAEVTRVKSLVSCRVDRFRPSYGHHAKDHPRQCIFAGTTNRDDWNRDETGARRFWPIACGKIDLDAIRANRDQFFAEAVYRFRTGDSWWAMPPEETEAEQDNRYTEDVWADAVESFIRAKSKITVLEIMTDCLKFDVAKIGKPDQMRVATCLRRMGWQKGKNERHQGEQIRFWRPKP